MSFPARGNYDSGVKSTTRIDDFPLRRAIVRLLGHQRARVLRSQLLETVTRLPIQPARADRWRARIGSGQPRRRGGPSLPTDYEPEFAELWELVRERTMTSHPKAYALCQAVRYVVSHNIPGAVVECGVWRGGSMLAVAHLLTRLDAATRELYLFDTYEGMTEPTHRDVQIGTEKSARARLAGADADSLVWAVASLEDVQQGFAEVSYPTKLVHFVRGPVEETVPDRAPEQIAILRLDTDWYESTKHELRELYHRLAPGGALILDDYGYWQGAKDAVDEFLAETGEPLLLVRAASGRIAIKPGLSSKVDG